jgi:hypothetical protein
VRGAGIGRARDHDGHGRDAAAADDERQDGDAPHAEDLRER